MSLSLRGLKSLLLAIISLKFKINCVMFLFKSSELKFIYLLVPCQRQARRKLQNRKRKHYKLCLTDAVKIERKILVCKIRKTRLFSNNE